MSRLLHAHKLLQASGMFLDTDTSKLNATFLKQSYWLEQSSFSCFKLSSVWSALLLPNVLEGCRHQGWGWCHGNASPSKAWSVWPRAKIAQSFEDQAPADVCAKPCWMGQMLWCCQGVQVAPSSSWWDSWAFGSAGCWSHAAHSCQGDKCGTRVQKHPFVPDQCWPCCFGG